MVFASLSIDGAMQFQWIARAKPVEWKRTANALKISAHWISCKRLLFKHLQKVAQNGPFSHPKTSWWPTRPFLSHFLRLQKEQFGGV